MRLTRGVSVFAAAVLMAVLGIQGVFAQAQTTAQTFTLQPGERAVVMFEAFCAQFGEDFPEGVRAPASVAPQNVQSALAYARQQGLTGSDQQATQVQYAIWQLLGAVDSPRGEQAAQDIVAQAATPPTAPQGATSLVEASQGGQVQITVDSWQSSGGQIQVSQGQTSPFFGRGQLTVENVGQQAVTLYVPVGTIFPSNDPADQDMVGYATDIRSSAAQQQQATTSPTTAATTSPTTAATTSPTTAATTSPTTAATTSPTTAATTSPTTAATTSPTTAATATTVATPTTSPTTLPNTSGGSGNALLLLVALALALLAGGVSLARGLTRS